MAGEFESLHLILQELYTKMMPLCADMVGVAKGIAGLGALFYVAAKVWQALARAEPVDVYPLLRPFAIGLCIMFFPTFVLGTINTVMSPVVIGCNNILKDQTLDMQKYSEQREKLEYEAMVRNPATAYLVSDEAYDKKLEELGWSPDDLFEIMGLKAERASYELKQYIRDAFRHFLELLFQAASLILDTLRTFFLIVLSILGPLVFALSVYDGFQAGLTQWLARYIGIYLWLPISDLFSSVLARIQVLMMEKDIEALSDPNFVPDNSNAAYIIFMLIGIVGYITIPTVASWVIQSGGAGSYGQRVTQLAYMGGKGAAALGGAAAGHAAGAIGKGIKSGYGFIKGKMGGGGSSGEGDGGGAQPLGGRYGNPTNNRN